MVNESVSRHTSHVLPEVDDYSKLAKLPKIINSNFENKLDSYVHFLPPPSSLPLHSGCPFLNFFFVVSMETARSDAPGQQPYCWLPLSPNIGIEIFFNTSSPVDLKAIFSIMASNEIEVI
jgi:hypothetical protein